MIPSEKQSHMKLSVSREQNLASIKKKVPIETLIKDTKDQESETNIRIKPVEANLNDL